MLVPTVGGKVFECCCCCCLPTKPVIDSPVHVRAAIEPTPSALRRFYQRSEGIISFTSPLLRPATRKTPSEEREAVQIRNHLSCEREFICEHILRWTVAVLGGMLGMRANAGDGDAGSVIAKAGVEARSYQTLSSNSTQLRPSNMATTDESCITELLHQALAQVLLDSHVLREFHEAIIISVAGGREHQRAAERCRFEAHREPCVSHATLSPHHCFSIDRRKQSPCCASCLPSGVYMGLALFAADRCLHLDLCETLT